MSHKKLIIIVGGTILILVLSLIYMLFSASIEEEEVIAPDTVERQGVSIKRANVEITETGFDPAVIMVKEETLVIFTNSDTKIHRIFSDPHPAHTELAGFDSQESIESGNSYSFFFENKGNYFFHDESNPSGFRGRIIVE